MVILLGGSEQDISMFLDTPRLRDEPRDEEGRDDGRLRGLHLRLHHRMLGDVDTGTDTATDTATGVRASPKDDCGMPWADCTKSLQRCGEAIERKASTGVDQQGEERAGFEDDGEDNKDNERTTEQRFESRRVTRYARYATDIQRQICHRYATPDTPDTPDTLQIRLIHRDTLSLQRGFVTSTRLVSEKMDERV